jgi:biotin synthase
MCYKTLVDKIVKGYEPNIEEIVKLLNLSEEEADYLFNAADKIREEKFRDEIQVRGIIEFSNYCRCKCLYCGLNCDNNVVERYRMEESEIIENAKEAIEAGYKTLVLQSGEDLWYTEDKITYIVKKIKELGDVGITLSIGERSYQEYKAWRAAGADRYLIKHETAEEELYNRLHPHSNFKNRINCLSDLKKLGYQVGSGFMIGLPGQTTEIIAKDILLLKQLDVDMAGIGPFISHPETELKGEISGSTFMTLKAVSVARLLLNEVHFPATTALGVISPKHKARIFNTGANVIMLKVEPYKYRRLYDIYPKPLSEEKSIKEERIQLENYITSLGKKVAQHKGDSVKIK